ncbi:MAG TPA: MerR family DNA-binding transcriptional regulator [Microlunatus sp.]|nr:MerR family DNA-binding transcriptional regulator [Microlunatus sp.]
MMRTWSIGELAGQFDTTLRTIRHYEELGLLSPGRNGQQRVYTERDRVRLELILRGKRLGFTLEEIAHILGLYDDPPGEAGQLEFLLTDIRRRRADLLQRRADLDAVLSELNDLERRCRSDLDALR